MKICETKLTVKMARIDSNKFLTNVAKSQPIEIDIKTFTARTRKIPPGADAYFGESVIREL